MEKYRHVIEDLKYRMNNYRKMSADAFMEKNSRKQHHYQDRAAGLDEAIEVIRSYYEEHPSE